MIRQYLPPALSKFNWRQQGNALIHEETTAISPEVSLGKDWQEAKG